ncbi:MAG: hypothetical protein POH28_08545 [Acidocella sp.]|nr:hypothetical protein [Acidocella sp.]
MSLSRHAGSLGKSIALWVGLAVIVLSVSLGGIAFLVAGFYMFLELHMGSAEAAAITGGGLFLLALSIGLTGGIFLKRLRDKRPGLLSSFGGGLGIATQLIGAIVRRDPKKALIVAALVGVLTEYVADNRKS